MKGQQAGLVLQLVDLVDDQDHRRGLGDHRQHLAVVLGEAPGFDDEEHQIDVGQHRDTARFIERLSALRCVGLEARGIDEHELRARLGGDAGDAVSGGLRLLGDDADLLPDQAVEQRRFADVGATDDRGDEAGAKAVAGGLQGGVWDASLISFHRGERELG